MRISTRLVLAGLISVLSIASVPVGAGEAAQVKSNISYCCR